MIARVVTAAAVLLLLAGCVPTSEIPSSELTEAERESWVDASDDQLWMSTGLANTYRPVAVDHVYVDQDGWVQALADCMVDIGHPAYDLDKASRILWVFDVNDPVEERVDWFWCQATYQVDPSEYGLMGSEILDFLHRYNTRVLVPCLEAHGVKVQYVPTRKEATFGGEFSGWNPYLWLYPDFNPRLNRVDAVIAKACPPYPENGQFDELRDMW